MWYISILSVIGLCHLIILVFWYLLKMYMIRKIIWINDTPLTHNNTFWSDKINTNRNKTHFNIALNEQFTNCSNFYKKKKEAPSRFPISMSATDAIITSLFIAFNDSLIPFINSLSISLDGRWINFQLLRIRRIDKCTCLHLVCESALHRVRTYAWEEERETCWQTCFSSRSNAFFPLAVF